MLTTRLPSTGPSVQKPIADARPSCGLKSRISAGVATRMTPSTKPMATNRIAEGQLAVRVRDADQTQQAGDEQADGDDVRAAVPVGDAGERTTRRRRARSRSTLMLT